MTTISTVFVANRGEVVSRIARTAHALGKSCVGVYTDSDARAAYLADVDWAVSLGADTASTPYLDSGALIAAARAAGADAVHPGYGFLAEDATFARDCIDAGLVWIGPPPDAIRAMGLKIEAKQAAARAGMRVLASITIDPALEDLDGVVTQAAELGRPLLVKPSAGGGGKGMHRVDDFDQLIAAIDAARREATAAFGDSTLFVERYIEAPRHIEIQILADQHGNVTSLGERDCSVQRRHQKVIEEAPAVGLPANLRDEMADAAVRLARDLGYVGAGTMEFLVIGGDYAFLEMNTRLQVEHAVTEEVLGIDLVELQLRIAEGEPLPVDLGAPHGHAIEARLYAEDPANNYLPSAGDVLSLAYPERRGVRWELGVRAGTAVNSRFDPMIAKIVATGSDREQAVARLAAAMHNLRISGVRTNRSLPQAVLESDEFRSGPVGTDFLERRPDLVRSETTALSPLAAGAVGAIYRAVRDRAGAEFGWAPIGWRNVRSADSEQQFTDQDQRVLDVTYRQGRDGVWAIAVNGVPARVRLFAAEAGQLDLEIDGLRRTYFVTDGSDGIDVEAFGATSRLTPTAQAQAAGLGGSAATYAAPLPGRLIAIKVGPGDVVAAGDPLVVLEAMKMEHTLTATGPARIAAVLAEVGDTVDYQQPLIAVDDGSDS